jgi:hypothetical protein
MTPPPTAQELAAWPVIAEDAPAGADAVLERGRIEPAYLPEEESRRSPSDGGGSQGPPPPDLPPTDESGGGGRPERPTWPRKLARLGIVFFFFLLAALGGAFLSWAWGGVVGRLMTYTLAVVEEGTP